MKKILFSLIIIIALLININIAEAQYAHPGTAIKTTNGNVQSDINALYSNIGSNTVEIGLVTAEIELIQNNLDTIESALDDLILNDSTQELEIANITSEILAIQGNLSTLEDLVNANMAWTTNEIALITAEILAIQNNLGTLEDRIVNNLDTIELELADITAEISLINDNLDTISILTEANKANLDTHETLINLKADSAEIHTDITQAYVNVMEFGAVGDGIVNDATAINNAINSLTSGGVVLFPAGYYRIASQITLTSKHGITLRGVGHGKNTTYLGTNIYATGFNGHHFRFIDCVGISVENMNLTAEGQDSSFGVGGLYFSLSSNSNNPYHSFRDLFISDISNGGIAISTPIMNNFKNVTVRKCVGDAFNVWSGTSTSFLNCYANNATETGFILTTMTYCTLQGCAAEGAGVGYYFDNSKSISVMGCGAEAIVDRGGAYNGYAYRSINGSNAITLYDCYDRISETGSFDESAGGIIDYINHKTDSNAQITKIHSLPASSSVYTDTSSIGATTVQTAVDTIAVMLLAHDIDLDSIAVAINNLDLRLDSAEAKINNIDLRLASVEVVFEGGSTGEVITRTDDGFMWAAPAQGVIDHLLLTNIGTKTHAQLELDIDSIESLLVTNYYTSAEITNLLAAIPDEQVIVDSSFIKITGTTVQGTLLSIDNMQNITEYLNQKGSVADAFVSIYTSGMQTGECQIFLDGVLQRPGFDYSIDIDEETFGLLVQFLTDIDNESTVAMSALRCNFFNYSPIDSGTHIRIESYTGSSDIWTGLIVPTTVENLLVTEIYAYAFMNPNIGSITLPEGLLTIGANAFWTAPITTINIPSTVTNIHEQAFDLCSSLETITVEEANTVYEDDGYALLSEDLTILYAVPSAITNYGMVATVESIGNYALKGSLIDSFTIHSGVTSIGNFALNSCYALTFIEIPATVITIGEYAFNQTPLTDMTLHEGLVEIKQGAFSACNFQGDIEIPASVTTIGDYAFSYNTFLTSATFAGDAPTTFGTDVFVDCDATFKIYYPAGASGWTNPWNGYTTEAY